MNKQKVIHSNPLPRKVNRYFKIIIINVLVITFLLITIDFLIYIKYKNQYGIDIQNTNMYLGLSYLNNYEADWSENSLNFYNKYKEKLNFFRPLPTNKFLDKKSILLFGCSFTYGDGLENDQTFDKKLYTLAKRNVYNFGLCATGIQHMYAFIQNPNLYKKIKEKPEHVIYTYIPDHMRRLNANIHHPFMTNGINLKYKIKGNSLILKRHLFQNFSKTFIIKALYYQDDLNRDNTKKEIKEDNAKLAKKLFLASKKELEKKYPNIKFTIIKYEIEDDNSENYETQEMWDELEKEGFTIIKSSDLIGRKFKYESEDTNQDGFHPSEYAWDLLVPPLVKELNL